MKINYNKYGMVLFQTYHFVQHKDLNVQSVLFGGKILEIVDLDTIIYIKNCIKEDVQLTTVGMENVKFLKPSFLGDKLKFKYRICHVGKTSLTIFVKVQNQKNEEIFEAYISVVRIVDLKPANVEEILLLETKNYIEVIKNDARWKFVEKMKDMKKVLGNVEGF